MIILPPFFPLSPHASDFLTSFTRESLQLQLIHTPWTGWHSLLLFSALILIAASRVLKNCSLVFAGGSIVRSGNFSLLLRASCLNFSSRRLRPFCHSPIFVDRPPRRHSRVSRKAPGNLVLGKDPEDIGQPRTRCPASEFSLLSPFGNQKLLFFSFTHVARFYQKQCSWLPDDVSHYSIFGSHSIISSSNLKFQSPWTLAPQTINFFRLLRRLSLQPDDPLSPHITSLESML